ncbi:MAG: MFS transporter, partial [Vicinamibacteraceae bacterium]
RRRRPQRQRPPVEIARRRANESDLHRMTRLLRFRLSVMMFLQFFVWGAWYATAGNYMARVGMADAIYWAYTASPIGSIVSPFFLGLIADRFFPVQKVLAVMHLLSGLFVLVAPLAAGSWLFSTPLFLALLLLHMLCYMPTVGLATAMAFHGLQGREPEFPWIRMFGTIGWIAAGFLVSFVLHADATAVPMQVAGIAGMVLGLYCFTLPAVPPPAAGRKVSVKDVLDMGALARLADRPFIVFLVSLLLTSIPLATYYAYAPVYLSAASIADPAFKMTFGQMAEVLFLLLLPFAFTRLGVKWVLLAGMLAWVVRYGLFAAAAPGAVAWMILIGIVLHGICYDFVYVAGQVYIDKKATRDIRARAQGLFVLVTYGIGQGLGTLVAGWLFNSMMTGDARQDLDAWQTFWIIPVAFASVVTLVFGLLFRDEVRVTEQQGAVALAK